MMIIIVLQFDVNIITSSSHLIAHKILSLLSKTKTSFFFHRPTLCPPTWPWAFIILSSSFEDFLKFFVNCISGFTGQSQKFPGWRPPHISLFCQIKELQNIIVFSYYILSCRSFKIKNQCHKKTSWKTDVWLLMEATAAPHNIASSVDCLGEACLCTTTMIHSSWPSQRFPIAQKEKIITHIYQMEIKT